MSVTIRKFAGFLAEFEIWVVAFLTGGSFAYSKLLPLVVGVAIFFWIIRWISKGFLTRRTPADVGIILLSVMALLSLWISPLQHVTLMQVNRLFAGIAIYYALVNWMVSQEDTRIILFGLSLVGVGLTFIAPISVTWYLSKLPFVPEAVYSRFVLLVSDTVHPNTMAGNLVLFYPLPLAWIFFSWKKSNLGLKAAALFALLIMLVVIILTKSRAGWIAVASTTIILVVLRWGRTRWYLAGVITIAGILLLIFNPVNLLELLTANDALGGFSGRAEIWSRAIAMVRDHPYTGIGMGAFPEIADTFYPFLLFSPHQIVHAHNLFLQVAIDLGLPGLIAWLAIFSLSLSTAWMVYRQGRRHEDFFWMGAGGAILCSHLALFLHGLTDAVTWGLIRITPLVWMIWGTTIALWYAQNRPVAVGVGIWSRIWRISLSKKII